MKAIDLHNAAIGSVSSRADHSYRFSVETPELEPEKAMVLIGLHGVAARILIAPQEMDADEVVEVTTERGVKTTAQRIRSTLFVLWKKGTEKKLSSIPFDTFYHKEVEKYLLSIGERIDALGN